MERVNASFWRRAAAGSIDFAIAFTATMLIAVVWLYSMVGPCDCSTEENIQEFGLAISLQAQSVAPGSMLLPLAVYAVASWTPVLGGRSIGMRALGLRVIRE